MREAMQRRDPEKGFVVRLGYSPEVASEISIRMMETVLEDADYLILRYYERKRRVDDGVEILSKVLTPDEMRQGFEITQNGTTKRTYVIPEEKDWSNLGLRPEIQKALQTIRRRGLLEFMTEEGYKFKNSQGQVVREVLGQKIPYYAQLEKAKEDNRKVISAKI